MIMLMIIFKYMWSLFITFLDVEYDTISSFPSVRTVPLSHSRARRLYAFENDKELNFFSGNS